MGRALKARPTEEKDFFQKPETSNQKPETGNRKLATGNRRPYEKPLTTNL